MTFAWVLNLDADLELAALASGTRYQPTDSVLSAMAQHSARLASSLLGADDVLVEAQTKPGSLRGLVGRAFCPTPRAIGALVRAGAEPEPHPSVAVLARVNGRAFCAALGSTLPRARFVRTATEAITAMTEITGDVRIKRAYGMAGRGQRVVRGAPSEADLGFIRRAVVEGGAMIEPNVVINEELALHAMLARDGSFRRGELVRQQCDRAGAWISSERIGDHPHEHAIAAELNRVALALHQEGYFGPFGIDAFTYREGLELQPRSEINARYSMAFAIGFGGPGSPLR
jgi:hypothetical protein